jgi:hypothetical protein
MSWDIGSAAHAIQLDVTKEEDWRFETMIPNWPIDELDLPRWGKTAASNLDSHFLSAKYFLLTIGTTNGAASSESSQTRCTWRYPG